MQRKFFFQVLSVIFVVFFSCLRSHAFAMQTEGRKASCCKRVVTAFAQAEPYHFTITGVPLIFMSVVSSGLAILICIDGDCTFTPYAAGTTLGWVGTGLLSASLATGFLQRMGTILLGPLVGIGFLVYKSGLKIAEHSSLCFREMRDMCPYKTVPTHDPESLVLQKR